MKHEPESGGENTNKQLRQLVHDLRTHLFIINMGIEALPSAQSDPHQFALILGQMQRDGVTPANDVLEKLAALAR